ncbi:MAG: divergent polysaccharide deacetylase family protein [Proteobacteria bacterium]|nr:divergent polysaccharide deacetylase family protein [Pseudomonadota bacterium]
MATPLGVRPGQRQRGIPPQWRLGLVVLLSVLVSVMLAVAAMRFVGEAKPVSAVAQIERGAEKVATRPAANAPTTSAAPSAGGANVSTIERQNTPGGGLVIKVPDNVPTGSATEPLYDTRVAERTDQGILPVVSASGHRAYKLYARSFAATDKPMIAIVMTGVGISARGTDAAIRKLPGEVTLAFAPYGRDLEAQVNDARSEGHEILLQVPMEPHDYPQSDPGPHTLRAGDAKGENIARLRWLMSRFTGYVGLTNFMGARLMRDQSSYGALLDEISRRGLLYLDDGTTADSMTEGLAKKARLPSATADRVAETDGRISLDQLLRDTEQIARKKGRAVITIPALPANIERVAAFARTATDRGVVLAPISAIMARNAP